MPSNPPVPALGANDLLPEEIDAIRLYAQESVGQYDGISLPPSTVLRLLGIVDVQAARLAAAEQVCEAAVIWNTVSADDEQAWAEADHALGLAIRAWQEQNRV